MEPSTTKIERVVYQLPFRPSETSRVTIETDISGKSQKKVVYVEHFSRKLSHPVNNYQLTVGSNFRCKEKKCFIGPGHYFVEQPTVFPKGYSLEILRGTTLLFSPAAYIFINGGEIKVSGTEDQPIFLGPAKKTWGGIYVVGESGRRLSTIEHTTIHGTRAFQHGLITLSGGVTFSDSSVNIQNSLFSQSVAEDALNVTNTSFHLSHNAFRDNRSDAFDSDYSDGKVANSQFENIGGDAIDLSGSSVQIQASNFRVISDKALSVGENSLVDLQSIDIVEAGIGIACKDGSILTGNDISILDSSLGNVFVYNKKSFFGGGRLVLENSKLDIRNSYIQFGSTGLINGQTLPFGNLDVKEIYAIEHMQKLTTM